MQVQKSQNVSFGAKQSVIGNCSEAVRTRLAEKLGRIGDDEFIHSVEFHDGKIIANSVYQKGMRIINIGQVNMLRHANDSEPDVIRNLVDFAKSQVEFFKKTKMGIMD